MNYHESYIRLNKKPGEPGITSIQTNGFNVIDFPFVSEKPFIPDETSDERADRFLLPPAGDLQIAENHAFSYPVFVPDKKDKFNRAIILLHGLNERRWVKYMPWAERLLKGLGRPVILFPISFHMNRAPESWSNPRIMAGLLKRTRSENALNRSASFVNLALSQRLSDEPLRFYTSGSQSAHDLINLTETIRSGRHPVFKKGAGTDIFAYSIGAFLSQILMLTYGNDLLSDSRLYMFCGGASFSNMNGVSKLIMDEEAFLRLRFYYTRRFERELRSCGSLPNPGTGPPDLMAFRSMLNDRHLAEWRNGRFRKMSDRIQAAGLANDAIIPPSGIRSMLYPAIPEIYDFPFSCSHENPFPVNGENPDAVDYYFEKVFRRAVKFLK